MEILDYTAFLSLFDDNPALAAWRDTLPAQLDTALVVVKNGHMSRWHDTLQQLPHLDRSDVDFNADCLRVGVDNLDPATRSHLIALLKQFNPWRKGPYCLHGIHLNTEWRSDWKWQRLQTHITPLHNRWVLDIGCGNGYHMWRMLGAGAHCVVGIDPTLISVVQFHAIQHFLGDYPLGVLPLGVEDLPTKLEAFDTVFSMGVLYHRRSPLEHLLELRDSLVSGGELVLETLVVQGEAGYSLVPEGRYAKMRNVWFIPTPATLESWLRRCGFQRVRCVDLTFTTPDEQRTTEWMTFESLADFLDPNDSQHTIEGHPAPLRGVFLAEKA